MAITKTGSIDDLLRQLRAIVVPPCHAAADRLTYIACRDHIIDAIRGCLGIEPEASPPGEEVICVSQEYLAERLIQETFDDHKGILRRRIQDCESEIERWKGIALAYEKVNSHTGPSLTCEVGTQTSLVDQGRMAYDLGREHLAWFQNRESLLEASLQCKYAVLVDAVQLLAARSSSSADSGRDVRTKSARSVMRKSSRTPRSRDLTTSTKYVHKDSSQSPKKVAQLKESPADQFRVSTPATETHMLYSIHSLPLQSRSKSRRRDTASLQSSSLPLI